VNGIRGAAGRFGVFVKDITLKELWPVDKISDVQVADR